MTRQKRILIGGLALNFLIYLFAAGYFSLGYFRQNQEQLRTLATAVGKVFQAQLFTDHNTVKNLIDLADAKKISFKEKLIWQESALFQLVGLFKRENSNWENVFQYGPLPNIPKVLEQTDSFHFLQFGADKEPYLLTSLNYAEDPDDKMMRSFLLAFKINSARWRELAKQLQFNYTFLELDYLNRRQTLFTNLSNEFVPDLEQHAASFSTADLAQIQKTFFENSASPWANVISFSGTKNIVFPNVLFESPKIQQALFYSLPLTDYREVDQISVVLVILALFCVGLGTFIVGLI